MAVASDSTLTPARPLLPFADPRTAVEILDDIRREVERQEAGPSTHPLPPAPLPSLPTAFSRRRAIFVDNETDEPQTARSIGLGATGWDFADVVDLASLTAARRRHAFRMAADAVDHLIALMDALDADVEDMEADSDDDRDLDDGREAEPDDEDGGDSERDLGWNETVSQLALGAGTDDGDLTALERHGRGFVRSGHDDAEDDDGRGDEDSGIGDEDGMAEQLAGWSHCPALAHSNGGYVA